MFTNYVAWLEEGEVFISSCMWDLAHCAVFSEIVNEQFSYVLFVFGLKVKQTIFCVAILIDIRN